MAKKSKIAKNELYIWLILLSILLMVLISAILVSPIEFEIHGKVSGAFNGLIFIPQTDSIIRNSVGNVEGDIKVKVPFVVFYMLFNR